MTKCLAYWQQFDGVHYDVGSEGNALGMRISVEHHDLSWGLIRLGRSLT
jgi:hypothetical protein